MTSRRILTVLLGGVLLLPIGMVLLVAAGRLLLALGDQPAASVLNWLALGVGLVWLFAAVVLLVAVAVAMLTSDTPRE